MKILGLIGYVIHFLGFGLWLLISVMSIYLSVTNMSILFAVPISLTIFLLPAWGINFLLTGHQTPLPWIENWADFPVWSTKLKLEILWIMYIVFLMLWTMSRYEEGDPYMFAVGFFIFTAIIQKTTWSKE